MVSSRFSRIAAPLTLILKTLASIKSITHPGEGVVRACSDSRAGCDGSKYNRSKFNRSKFNRSGISDNKVDNEDDNEFGKKD